MIIIALMLLQAAVAEDGGRAALTSPRPDWIRKPDAESLMSCARPLPRLAPDVVVTMRCATAPHDQIRDCAVVSNTRAPDVRYDRAALCATKFFRIRARGADGPAMGVPVIVPFGFISPSTYAAMVKAARAGPYVAPAEGTVDEVVVTIEP